jgi:WD40 repeat protein
LLAVLVTPLPRVQVFEAIDAVSPDGTELASCGDDGAIQIWNLDTHEHLRTLRHDRPYERLNITGIRGLTEAEIATLQALGAFEE